MDVSFFVRAQEAGAQVPVHFALVYSGLHRRHHSTITRTVSVSSGTTKRPRPAQEPRPLVRVLFLGANPRGTRPLWVDEEIREIQQTIEQGRERDHIVVETEWAVRPRDIIRLSSTSSRTSSTSPGMVAVRRAVSRPRMTSGTHTSSPWMGWYRHSRRSAKTCSVSSSTRAGRSGLPGHWLWSSMGHRHAAARGRPVGDPVQHRLYQALAAGKPVRTAFDVGKAHLMMTPEEDDALAPLLLHGFDGGA